jgi:hypothetical protein
VSNCDGLWSHATEQLCSETRVKGRKLLPEGGLEPERQSARRCSQTHRITINKVKTKHLVLSILLITLVLGFPLSTRPSMQMREYDQPSNGEDLTCGATPQNSYVVKRESKVGNSFLREDWSQRDNQPEGVPKLIE